MLTLSDYNYGTYIVKSRLDKEMKILDAELGNTSSKVVLDVGCGTGKSYFPEYVLRGLKVVGMGRNIRENLSVARKELNPNENIYLLAGDANNIPLAAESVDILFLCQVLEHLDTPERAIKEAYRVLKKGGVVLIDVPWLSEVYRPLSALILRALFQFKHEGKVPWLLKILFKNLDDIDNLKASSMLQRRQIASPLIGFVHLFPTFRSVKPEYFVYNYYRGTIEGDAHLQFRFPGEWAEVISQAEFKIIKKTGAFITPPLFYHLQLGNMLFSKLEHCLRDNILLWLSHILIIVATKT